MFPLLHNIETIHLYSNDFDANCDSLFQESVEGCDRATTVAGHHEQHPDDVGAVRRVGVVLRALVLRHDLPRRLPGLLRSALLLLPQRRGQNYEIMASKKNFD